MPHRTVPGTAFDYELISFDAQGNERTDDPAGKMSDRVIGRVKNEKVTDLFCISHGWKGDLPAAIEQYDRWIPSMAQCPADIQRARQRPGFRSLVVGLHWPSLPWGDEEMPAAGVSFDVSGAIGVEILVDRYAERIADTAAARAALRTVFNAARQDPNPQTLPPEVIVAYNALNAESGMGSDGPAASPGADRLSFDPEQRYQSAREERGPASFGIGDSIADDLLSPLRQLSFWKMKDRGRVVGESGIHTFLRQLMSECGAVRVHLMGHSFGCIVVTSAIVGAHGGAALPRPIQSLALVQGALSLWSYTDKIPSRPTLGGYFRPLIEKQLVQGAVVTTQSVFDRAVGTWYPKSAGIAGQVEFRAGELDESQLPEYGGLGTFGIRGSGLDRSDLEIGSVSKDYGLKPLHIHNVESSSVIRNGGGLSGAHSDIAHPEVAHLIWSAALA